VDVLQIAWWFELSPSFAQSEVPTPLKVTVPPPVVGLTVAVKVTVDPEAEGFGDAVTVVCVTIAGLGLTTKVTVADVYA
jgi:hypothetical protein